VPEAQHRATLTTLSHLTQFLRWAAQETSLAAIGDLTPALWFDYLDHRLAAGRSRTTVNVELAELHQFLRFLADQGRPVCERTLQVRPLKEHPPLPRDVPLDQLRRLREQIEAEAASPRADRQRMGRMDRAWFLLMLHSGLRVGEIHRLERADLDLEGRKVRVEQSKGLKDRVVYLSAATVEALHAYFEVRGPATTDHAFLFRHKPLTETYCGKRLATYGRRCGVKLTCHQLRHSFGTLILNAGAPILAVQAIMGHRHVDTTLIYARLYDGKVAADYYRAMGEVEARMELDGLADGGDPPNSGYLLALVDALGDGTLNDAQRDTVYALREGILALPEQPGAHWGA